MIINKRLIRNIKLKKSFFIGSILLCMLTVSFIIAATSAGNTMTDAVEKFLKDYNVEDAQFNVITHINDDEISQLEEEYDVQIEIMQYADIDIGETTLRVFPKTEKINRVQLKDGNDSLTSNRILISNDYARENNYELNGKISLNNDEYNIMGYFTRPDYIYMLKSLSDTYVNNNLFGIAVLSESNFKKLDNIQSYYSVVYEKDNSIEFRKKVNDKYKLISYLDSSSNIRIQQGAKQGEGVSGMAFVFALIFFILNMGLIAIVLSRMVQNERKILGVLFALGYKKREIVRYYVKYPMVTAIFGSITGVIGGIYLVKPFLNMYCGQYNFPLYQQQYSIISLIISFIAPFVLFVLTAYLVVLKMLKKSAVDLLRGAKKEQKRVFFVGSKLSNSMKYGLRSSMRNKGRSIIFIFGIIVASVLILVGLTMNSSCQHLLKEQVQSSTNYKYSYTLNQIQKDYPYETGMPYLSETFESSDKNGRISLVGIEFDSHSEYFPLVGDDGTLLDNKCTYISRALSELYQLKEGDTFNLYDPITLEEYSITVDGITNNRTQKSVYMSLENAAEFLGYESGSYNGIYSNQELDIDSKIVQLKQNGSEVTESYENLLKPLMVVIYILVILGFILGIIVINIISKMVIDESTPNISMLKVLGYKIKEILKMTFNINYLFILIGYLISIPIVYLFCTLSFRAQIAILNVFIEVKITVLDFCISILLVYLSYFITILFAKRKIKKINMVESMKDNRE